MFYEPQCEAVTMEEEKPSALKWVQDGLEKGEQGNETLFGKWKFKKPRIGENTITLANPRKCQMFREESTHRHTCHTKSPTKTKQYPPSNQPRNFVDLSTELYIAFEI